MMMMMMTVVVVVVVVMMMMMPSHLLRKDLVTLVDLFQQCCMILFHH